MRNRAGFSRSDVLSAVVMSVLVIATILQLLSIRSRWFERVEPNATAVAPGEVAASALSELRRTGGAGLVYASARSITLRVPYAVGVVCSGEPYATVAMVPAEAGALDAETRAGLGWRDARDSLHMIESTVVRDSAAAASCATAGIHAPHGAVFARLSRSVDASAIGAPAVLFREIHYAFRPSAAMPGSIALWRTEAMRGESVELIGPFADRAAFRFYVDGSTTPTGRVPAPLSRVRGIELHLPRAGSGATSALPPVVFFHDRAD